MLDLKYIRGNKEIIKKAIYDKQLQNTLNLDELLELDAKYLQVLKKTELHRNLKNELSKKIPGIKEKDEKQKLIEKATKVKSELSDMETELKKFKDLLDILLLKVPNPPAKEVPYGEGENDNVVLRKVGTPKVFEFKIKDHVELGEALGILDVDRGVKIAGFRGYFLKNEGAELEMAVLKYALDYMKTQGFDFYTVPWLVKPDYFVGTGYFPWGEEDHYITQDGLALIGTAEVSLTSYYAGEVLREKDLPIKMMGLSPCFRREVGSYGKDTKGIFRIHQFTKLEQVVLLPEGEEFSREWHEKMLSYAEEILQNLGLSYQIVLMCSGDMGAGQRKKFDVETWFPAQQAYRETHSDSYFLDFQSRRLNMRYKSSDGSLKYVYTLNNTVVATPRLLATILETYQQEDGSVKIPDVLHKYLDFKDIKPKKK